MRTSISLAANPSHLEAVDPVVLGKVRAKQTQMGDVHRNHVMGISSTAMPRSPARAWRPNASAYRS
ncbi:MAG: hypothetical protein U1E35_04735 [Rhodospirillales bacterium]